MSLKRTVLVVDDEEDLRGVIASEFMFQNWTTLEASSGTEALQLLESNKVDAVISDIRMPNGDGVFLCEEISKKFDKPIVILMSSFNDADAQKLKELDVFKIFTKPFNISEVYSLIKEAVDLKTPGQFQQMPDSKVVKLS